MNGFTRLVCCVAVMAMGSGCLVDASKLAGYSNPKVKITKNAWGIDVECGTNFAGTAKGEYDPTTKKITFDVQVTSDASGVVGAEGERADHLVELRRIETTYYLEAQKTVGENFKAFGTMLALAAAGGGDAVAKVVEAATPLLAGSAVGMGPLKLNLGAAEVPKPEPGATPAVPPLTP